MELQQQHEAALAVAGCHKCRHFRRRRVKTTTTKIRDGNIKDSETTMEYDNKIDHDNGKLMGLIEGGGDTPIGVDFTKESVCAAMDTKEEIPGEMIRLFLKLLEWKRRKAGGGKHKVAVSECVWGCFRVRLEVRGYCRGQMGSCIW